MRPYIKLALGAVAAVLCLFARADSVQIPTNIRARTPINVAHDGLTATSAIMSVDDEIEDGVAIGAFGHGRFCSDPEILSYDKKDGYFISLQSAQNRYAKAVASLGYPKYEQWVSAFEDKQGSDPDFAISIKILDVKFRRCMVADSTFYRIDAFGNGYLKAEWNLKYARTQDVVYSKVVEASIAIPIEKAIRYEDLEDVVFSQLVANVLGDPEYVSAFKNAVPVSTPPKEALVDKP
jgi:hypothetical protein